MPPAARAPTVACDPDRTVARISLAPSSAHVLTRTAPLPTSSLARPPGRVRSFPAPSRGPPPVPGASRPPPRSAHDFCRRDHSAERRGLGPAAGDRSEEHTSELQSRGHLVCRLLLEKKNTR